MGIFDKQDHIKKTGDLKKALKSLSNSKYNPKDKKEIMKMFRDDIVKKASGLSKKEFEKGLKSAYGSKESKLSKEDINRFRKAA